MYESFFGLQQRPFDLAPDPRFLFLAPRHGEALSMLRYGLSTPKGLTLLLGEAGTGKTTLVQAALDGLDSTRHVLLTNPTLRRDEFYEFLARGFGMSEEAAGSKTRFLLEFRRDLETWFQPERPSAIIIDEAQALSNELLEEVRLLTNFETDSVKLLNVVLTGQPELGERLNQPSLRQLKQRVALRCSLEPFDLGETASYISGRIRRAGGSPADVFTRPAVLRIFEASGGVPRTINVISDNAMLGGFGAGQKPVDRGIVDEVCRDFDLRARTGAVSQASRRKAPAAARPPQTAAPGPPAVARVERPAPDGVAGGPASAPSGPGEPASAEVGPAGGSVTPSAGGNGQTRAGPPASAETGELFSQIAATKKRLFSFFRR